MLAGAAAGLATRRSWMGLLASGVVFCPGLGVGLQFNVTLGALLWVVAGAIVVANVVWMVRR